MIHPQIGPRADDSAAGRCECALDKHAAQRSEEPSMTITTALIYAGLIGYVIFRKIAGQSVGAAKKLFAAPIILVVLGYGDLGHAAAMKTGAITVTVIGAVIALTLGMLRGRADKLSIRDGSPVVKWGSASLVLFAANILAKVALDLLAVKAGVSGSVVGNSLMLSFGLTLLGEAIVIWLRTTDTPGLRTALQQARN
jgi:hypothetical protein